MNVGDLIELDGNILKALDEARRVTLIASKAETYFRLREVQGALQRASHIVETLKHEARQALDFPIG